MDKAQLILYGVATYLAIKSLLSLMADHRQNYKKKLAEELKAAAPASPPVPPPNEKDKKIAAPMTLRAAVAAPQPAVAKNAAKPAIKETAKPEPVAKKAG
jgi:hypothetical protein